MAIARALANDPILLLADEPTGNLDSVSADGIFNLFAELHKQRGVTIVLITHDPDLAARAERISAHARRPHQIRRPGRTQKNPHAPAALRRLNSPRRQPLVRGAGGEGG